MLLLLETDDERVSAMFGAEIEFLSLAFDDSSRIRWIDLHPANRINELLAGDTHHPKRNAQMTRAGATFSG